MFEKELYEAAGTYGRTVNRFKVEELLKKGADYKANYYFFGDGRISKHSVSSTKGVTQTVRKTILDAILSFWFDDEIVNLFLHEALVRGDYRTIKKITDNGYVVFPEMLKNYMSPTFENSELVVQGSTIDLSNLGLNFECVDKLCQKEIITDKAALKIKNIFIDALSSTFTKNECRDLVKERMIYAPVENSSLDELYSELLYLLGRRKTPRTDEKIRVHPDKDTDGLLADMEVEGNVSAMKEIEQLLSSDQWNSTLKLCLNRGIGSEMWCRLLMHPKLQNEYKLSCIQLIEKYKLHESMEQRSENKIQNLTEEVKELRSEVRHLTSLLTEALTPSVEEKPNEEEANEAKPCDGSNNTSVFFSSGGGGQS